MIYGLFYFFFYWWVFKGNKFFFDLNKVMVDILKVINFVNVIGVNLFNCGFLGSDFLNFVFSFISF